jgi:hypothetical protein
METILTANGLRQYWDRPELAAHMSKEGWKEESYKAVEEAGDMERHNRMIAQPSTHLYQYTKDWGRVPETRLLLRRG